MRRPWGAQVARRIRRSLGVHNATQARLSDASAVRQAVSGIRWTMGALLWLAIILYGGGWLILGGDIGRTAPTDAAVRLLGLVLICTSANVARAIVKRRAILRAWIVNVAAACGVVAALYLLLAPK